MSPAINAAIRLTGINDSYVGAAPDMGANESGALVDAPLDVATRFLSLEDPTPNPSRSGTLIAFTLPHDGPAQVRCSTSPAGICERSRTQRFLRADTRCDGTALAKAAGESPPASISSGLLFGNESRTTRIVISE